ncbi:H-NS histone family protein [Paraburkholderia aspalathi]|uniref:H-NS histone family protein n=1 Tax=Paraburkholderia nemoris TaxID=2793076 RepID=UPI00190B9C2C|nr:H-NS histone family protein [Paraburkholderia nemoris]MBK3786995.1 H-NS histone family protein [Paraburkholderia aspalathi]MBK3787115.1 H-NS histone family protein [Paraburkholderia aspalathi]
MSSYLQLLAQRAQLDADIAAARAAERRAAIEQIRNQMTEYGITAAELDERRGRHRVPASQLAPRYRDPVSGATWSGRGRPPRWLAGRDRQAYRIDALPSLTTT